MSERPSATVLTFKRPAAAVPDAKPVAATTELAEDPQVRLARALAALDKALAAQRAAVGDWRDSLGKLRGSVGGLAESLGTYQARLGELAEQVDGVNQQARALESWAEGVLAAEPAAP